ncbi:MAG TPA: hypothetical protein VN903_28570 [Polyangia bacterium]|nr:hypothetical protein [Polyangia bacterium]
MDQHAVGAVACAVGAALGGWLGQHFLKANKDFSTNAAHAAAFAIAFVLYAISSPFQVTDPATWILAGVSYATAAIGFGSAMAGFGLAAKTDSR